MAAAMGEAEEDVAEPSESFGERVEGDPDEHRDAQDGGPPVAQEQPEERADDHERGGVDAQQQVAVACLERPGGECPPSRARVVGIDLGINDPVEEHRPVACKDHAEHDEDEHLAHRGPVDAVDWRVAHVRRDEEGPEDGKGHGEHRVGELNVAHGDEELGQWGFRAWLDGGRGAHNGNGRR